MYEVKIIQPCKNIYESQHRILVDDKTLTSPSSGGGGYASLNDFSKYFDSFDEISVNNILNCDTSSVGSLGLRLQYGDVSTYTTTPLFEFDTKRKPKNIYIRLNGTFTYANTMSFFRINYVRDEKQSDGTFVPKSSVVFMINDSNYSYKYALQYIFSSSSTIYSISDSNLINLDIYNNINDVEETKNHKLVFYQTNTNYTYSQQNGAVYIKYLEIVY